MTFILSESKATKYFLKGYYKIFNTIGFNTSRKSLMLEIIYSINSINLRKTSIYLQNNTLTLHDIYIMLDIKNHAFACLNIRFKPLDIKEDCFND